MACPTHCYGWQPGEPQRQARRPAASPAHVTTLSVYGSIFATVRELIFAVLHAPGVAVAADRAIERVAFDGYTAGLADEPSELIHREMLARCPVSCSPGTTRNKKGGQKPFGLATWW